ncbi:hypothetical protein FNV43_RR01387 [Rhamnella rubrinervis]|uniref:Terpene synthase metal-binding domain-containing protein n=1 Tax=Rhamnella rubrinervis TaxID=2594499 RepID=A0A8K0HSB8_9ROSA|nr:hypothetical protein FNV43_RR01387 [Rhamnella rubrinervis]
MALQPRLLADLRISILVFGGLFPQYASVLEVVERFGLCIKATFYREAVVECYFWITGVYFEPQYALARRIVTKVMAVTSVIDDIYDVYATFDELQVFTEAIESNDDQRGKIILVYYAKEEDRVVIHFTTTSFLGMGDIATKEVFIGFQMVLGLSKLTSTICRLMDGVVDHKEHNKGHGDSASGVECYMNKHGVWRKSL